MRDRGNEVVSERWLGFTKTGGGGVLSEKFGGGVWPASQKPYPIYDKNCDIPYPIYDLNPVQTNV